MGLTVFLGLVSALSPVLASANTIHVPAESPTIQDAIASASEGDTVLVAPGEYSVRDPITFLGKGVTVRSEEGAASTVLRKQPGSYRGSVVIFERQETESAVLEGFTITGGTGTDMDGTNKGGGILCLEGANPTLRGLVLTRNASTYGGGLHLKGAGPKVIDCVLSENRVTCGGGAYCDGATGTFVGCTVTGNRGSYFSSGIHSKSHCVTTIDRCVFLGNATANGGGLDANESQVTVTNSLVAGNYAQQGGAMICNAAATVVIRNCTIVFNRASQEGGISLNGAALDMANCIVWGNSPEATLYPAMGSLIGRDPLFVNPGVFDVTRFTDKMVGGEYQSMPDFVLQAADFHLQVGSPGINSALPELAPSLDLDGQTRPCSGLPDIGAYESCGPPPHPFLRGDSNGDMGVDLADAVYILLDLFVDAKDLRCLDAADANDDGRIDVADPLTLLGYLFQTGALPAPVGSCATDPTVDALGCAVGCPR